MSARPPPASPLLETGHHDPPASPRSSSDFVLLTTADALQLADGALATRAPHPSPSAPTRLARPRFLPVLQIAALLDLVSTVGLALRVPIKTLPPSTVAINFARSLIVGGVVSSPRVREFGPAILAQLAVTALVLLFRLNELVQSNAAFSPPSSMGAAIVAATDLLNPTTEWYLASFGWSCVHYLLFAGFVGFTRERNPLAGRMKRSSTWGEQRWEGTQVAVDGATLAASIRSRSSFSGGGGGTGSEAGRRLSDAQGEDAYSGSAEEGSATGTDQDGFSSSEEDDENDIVDVPRQYRSGGLTAATSSLRHRPSHASLLSVRGPVSADPSLSTSPGSRLASGLGAVRNYGSINSLGKSSCARAYMRGVG